MDISRKKITLIIALILLILNMQAVFADGPVYETKQIPGNKIRITIKWSNSAEAKGIALSYFYIENGKTLNIGYELKSNAPKEIAFDYDLTSALPPIRILLKNAANGGEPPFSDIKNIEQEEYIWHLHDAGIVMGSSGNLYKPYTTITRAEFITLIVRALKLSGTPANTKGFKDINTHWAKNALLLGVQYGFLSGYSDKTLRPNNPITVAEVCTIISKAFRFKTISTGTYSKLKQNVWYTASVKKMFDSGILKISDGIYKNFNEQSNINRADSAMMISRALSTY
ncbi:MAG: S-layer homology domain-containing protein [Bacillota bacterium]|nr:S-layer homology domain-containing protein [Bacillota bacterium]